MNREEAINVVKCNWPEGRHQLSEALKTLIPEFQESEDERIRKILIHIVKGACCKYGIKYIGDDITEEKLLAYIERQKEYIEDVRQYAYNKGLVDAEEKQKPAEWSKEEIGHLYTIARYIKSNGYEDDGEFLEGVANKLKSLRPQPHWKPSVEQMEWLESAVKLSTDKPRIHGIIISLYEQLKKL